MQKQVEQEMLELNNQFSEFLKTKGIKAKFKLAFSNMKESAKKQHEQEVKNFNEIKTKSIINKEDIETKYGIVTYNPNKPNKKGND